MAAGGTASPLDALLAKSTPAIAQVWSTSPVTTTPPPIASEPLRAWPALSYAPA
jgi:hypothetical protein